MNGNCEKRGWPEEGRIEECCSGENGKRNRDRRGGKASESREWEREKKKRTPLIGKKKGGRGPAAPEA